MNGIWIRSEDGEQLVQAKMLEISCPQGDSYYLEVECSYVAEYGTLEAALRQLDDIQEWMWGGVSGITDSGVINFNVYDLRERKVKEDD